MQKKPTWVARHDLGSARPRPVSPAWIWRGLGLELISISGNRFPCRRHLEKVPRKRQTTHENRALKTRFRAQNRVFETRVAKNIYSF